MKFQARIGEAKDLKPRVLLVDREQEFLKELTGLLKQQGFTVTSATSTVKAIIGAKGLTFSVVIVDSSLLDYDGISLFSSLDQAGIETQLRIVLAESSELYPGLTRGIVLDVLEDGWIEKMLAILQGQQKAI